MNLRNSLVTPTWADWSAATNYGSRLAPLEGALKMPLERIVATPAQATCEPSRYSALCDYLRRNLANDSRLSTAEA